MNRRSFLAQILAGLWALIAWWFLPAIPPEPTGKPIIARPRRMPIYDTEGYDGETLRGPLTFFASTTPFFQARVSDIPCGAPKYLSRRSPKKKHSDFWSQSAAHRRAANARNPRHNSYRGPRS